MKSGEREGAVACSFFWSQPKLNYGVLEPDPNHPWELPFDHADIRALWADMFGIIRYWLALGVDGFRTDSARRICPDHPPLGNVARFPKEYLPYHRNRHGGLIAIPTGNHDYMRAATERSTVMVRALFGAVLTIPCLPFIYYGDEIGMPFLSGLTSKEGGYRVTGARRLRRDDTIDLDESGWLILALSRAAKAAGKRRFRRVPKQCVAPHSKGGPKWLGGRDRYRYRVSKSKSPDPMDSIPFPPQTRQAGNRLCSLMNADFSAPAAQPNQRECG